MLHDPYSYTLDPPVDSVVDTTPRTTDYPVAILHDLMEMEISSVSWDGEATLPSREDPFFGTDAHAQSIHGYSGQRNVEVVAPYTDFVSPNTSTLITQGNSLFSGAHDFVVNNPIMVADTTSETRRKMMKLLRKKALVDATYDSAARHDSAPHCHPDTRVPFRERIIAWLLNMDREEALFWLSGPAGVGKSAIAQYIMEYCAEHGFPGAGIFLSRANKYNNPNRIIPSLAHQLAIKYPAYSRTLTNLLSADPTILEKRLPLQFQLLIDGPADIFKLAGDLNVQPNPILLLFDGLDECDTESAQCELIRLVASFASTCRTRRLPIICVITSRPEWQIVSAFNQLGSNLKPWREVLSMDTAEAFRDVEKVLRTGFERIRSKHDDEFAGDTEWPARAKFRAIKTAAAGNMLFASAAVKFIDDDDPITQLELCLKFLRGKLMSDERNPFDPLSALYEGMLRSISPNHLPTALLILYLQVISADGTYFTAQASANFFQIDRQTFYLCLQKLRSVLRVPPHSEAGRDQLWFSHTTFADYLKVAIQTGSFGLREADALEHIRTRCIQWHDVLKGNNDEYLSGIVPWYGKGIAEEILYFSRKSLFKLWNELFHHGDLVKLQEELRHFAFKDLPRKLMFTLSSDARLMRDLAENLIDYQNKNTSPAEDCLVRTTPVCPADQKLLENYASLIGQWGASVQPFDPTMADHKLSFIFYSADDPFDDDDAADLVSEIQWSPSLSYLFLGYGPNTVLVIVYPVRVKRDVYWQGAFERIKTTHAIACGLENPRPNPNHALDRLYFQVSQGDDSHAHMVGTASLERTLVSFIADASRNPLARLEVVANILSVISDPSEIIHLLFQYTLHNIPCEFRSVVQRILAFLLSLFRNFTVHLEDLQEVFHLDHATISQVISWLHPFVFSWSPTSNSHTIYLKMQLPYYDLQQKNIKWEDDWEELGYHPYFRLEERAWQEAFVLWLQLGESYLRTGQCLLRSAVHDRRFLYNASKALRSIRTNDGFKTVAIQLRNFPFCHPELEANKFGGAGEFRLGLKDLVHKLFELVSVLGPIIRTQPICEVDRLLLEKWAKMGHDFEFAKIPINRVILWRTSSHLLSLHNDIILPPVKQGYRVFLLGYEHNTCLVAMSPHEGYTWEGIEGGKCRGERLSNETEVLDDSEDDDGGHPNGTWSWNMTPVDT